MQLDPGAFKKLKRGWKQS